MKNITSLQNPQIKLIRQLNKRKYRDQLQLFLIEGKREIERAIQCGLKPHSYYYSTENENILSITPANILAPRLFEKITYQKNSSGHLAIFYQPPINFSKFKPKTNSWLLIIESPEKPGNIGALLRTADAVNIDAVIITDPDTDLFNPNVIRSACGTFFSRPIYLTDNITALAVLKKHHINLVATTPGSNIIYNQIEYPSSIALIAGREDTGLSDFWLKNADIKIKIPMAGIADSLNLSVSTGIILYQISRQRNNN